MAPLLAVAQFWLCAQFFARVPSLALARFWLCANCKTSHLRNEDSLGKVLVYVGDGLSDYCASLQAHLVFAKDSLAGNLRQKGKKFVWFKSLRDVHDALKGLSHE